MVCPQSLVYNKQKQAIMNIQDTRCCKRSKHWFGKSEPPRQPRQTSSVNAIEKKTLSATGQKARTAWFYTNEKQIIQSANCASAKQLKCRNIWYLYLIVKQYSSVEQSRWSLVYLTWNIVICKYNESSHCGSWTKIARR